MKFAIVILAAVAVASAQVQYNPFNYQYNPGQYNPGQYNAGQYNPFARKPYSSIYSTPAPPVYRPFVSSTPAPVVYSPSTFAPVTPTPVIPTVPKAVVYNGDARNANIVKAASEINPDGSYSYFYETDNGIAAEERGTPRNFGGNPPVAPNVAQGSYSYTSPEGIPVAIAYVADENGFQASGNVIPTAPPVPALIARALEYLARNAPAQ